MTAQRLTPSPVRLAPLLAALLLAACAVPASPPPPATGMEAVLQEEQRMRVRRVEDLSPEDARREPHLIDAARAVRNVQGLAYPEEEVPRVQGFEVPGAAGPLQARIYAPQETRNTPVVLMFPAGGWVTPSLDASDASARALAARTGTVVLLVQPRAAPEARFPAAHEDALSVYGWMMRHGARALGADPSRLVVAGEGTGGTLALSTALSARNRGLGNPDGVLLLTPVVSTAPASAPQRWGQDHYAARAEQADPRLDPAGRAVLQGLPPVSLVLSEHDPQAATVQLLIARLTEAGVPVRGQAYAGTVPGFFGLGAIVEQARQAQDWAAGELARWQRLCAAPRPADRPQACGPALPPARRGRG